MMTPAVTRVLQLVTLSAWGGAQQHVLSLARGLRDRYDMTVACSPGGPLVHRARQEGIRVIEVPGLTRLPHLRDLQALVFLVRLMRSERFALVHCHSTKAGVLGRIAARLAGVPAVVFTAHAWQFVAVWPGPLRLAIRAAERQAARLSTAIICVSEFDRQQALRAGIGPPDRLFVVPNGVDPAAWMQDRARPPAGSHAERPATAIMVGRLAVPKDPATLLEAWRRIGPPHRLILVGAGPLLADVRRRIQRDGLADRVVLMDPASPIPSLLREADLFVLCSRWEGVPLAIIEAMMSGLPVVATRVGGVPEVVSDGETGVLVPPHDPQALASALNQLLRDPERRRRMGEAGQRRALACFTETHMLAATAQVYARALAAAGHAAEDRRHEAQHRG